MLCEAMDCCVADPEEAAVSGEKTTRIPYGSWSGSCFFAVFGSVVAVMPAPMHRSPCLAKTVSYDCVLTCNAFCSLQICNMSDIVSGDVFISPPITKGPLPIVRVGSTCEVVCSSFSKRVLRCGLLSLRVPDGAWTLITSMLWFVSGSDMTNVCAVRGCPSASYKSCKIRCSLK